MSFEGVFAGELLGLVLLLALGVLFGAANATAQDAPRGSQQAKRAPHAAKPAASPETPTAPLVEMALEPKAVELLKATSNRLAAAKSMAFTALVTYENPSRLGPPLIYMARSQVTLQRPDKLRVITTGDGPASEFYYDGQAMVAFAPAENLVALAEAPPTIDAALHAVFDSAAIYFPFTDLIVADPYQDLADGMKVAFYIGQSSLVGGTTTDIVAYATDSLFAQLWIGAQDQLPRMIRVVYNDDASQLRHQMELSDWELNAAVPMHVFGSPRAAVATRIDFARPDPQVAPLTAKPLARSRPAKTRPAKTR